MSRPATPVFDSLAAPTIVYGTSTTTLSGHLAAGSLIPPGDVAITLDGTTEPAAIDPAMGTFSASFPTSALGASASPYTIGYAFAATTNFAAASATTNLTVNKADQTIHWTSPADIVYGTPLGRHSSMPPSPSPGPDTTTGALSYSPAAGTVLHAGDGQTLTVNAAATANYNAATLTVTINVQKATPTVTWANPADIVYGTPLGAAQLDAAATVAGTFAYTPAAGTFLNAGQGQTLSATFTPDDSADYNAVPVTAPINVAPAPLTVTADECGHRRGPGPSRPSPPISPASCGARARASWAASSASACRPAPPARPGQYPITPGGLTSANYAITYVERHAQRCAAAGPRRAPPVTVQSVLWQTEKLSHHKTAKVLVVTFSGALNAGDAQDLARLSPGRGRQGQEVRHQGRQDGEAHLGDVQPESAHTVTLTTKGTVPNQPLQLTINAALVLDAQGQQLDGNRDGQPGGNFVATLGK